MITDKVLKTIDKINSDNPYNTLSLHYDIEVLPYARPRKGRNGFYNPRDKYKRELTKMFKADLEEFGEEFPVQGEVILEMEFGLKPPESIKKSKLKLELTKLGILHPVVRPDVDNYIKPIMDAMNGVLYEDDGQVFRICASKVYTEENPSLNLNIKYRKNKIKMR